MSRFPVTLDNERLLERLKAIGKIPANLQFLTGLNVVETVDETGTGGLSVILGPLNTGRRGRKPQAIPVALDRARRPEMRGDKIIRADVVPDDEDGYLLVRQEKQDVAIRNIVTGLLEHRGSTVDDFADIMAGGGKLRYHGVFPITADAASIIGEGIDLNITSQSKVLTDERFGNVRGLVGIPKQRVVQVEAVIGGPILVGQIDGRLKIHELTKDGWKSYDVTEIASWQQKFMDLAVQDVEYLAAIERDKKRREKKIRIVRPPSDHMDA